MKFILKQSTPRDFNSGLIKRHEKFDHFVSNGIGNKFKLWDDVHPVIISAPTGSGKNHFVENKILPYAIENNKNVLIVSNRIAVSLQQKARIAKLLNMEDLLEKLTPIGLQEYSDFGNVTILTYHKLYNYLRDSKRIQDIANFDFVIFDETHFFVSDSLFNPHTGELLGLCTSKFFNAVRIYISATIDDVLPKIIEVESRQVRFEKRSFLYTFYIHLYDFKRSYKHIIPTAFKSEQNIVKEILADKTDEKWLIFVSSKKQGQQLNKDLQDAGCTYIDSSLRGTQDGEKLFSTLIDNQKFSSKVLISTSLLDNGVNFKDSKLKNIVLFTYDKSEFIQMLGRKRVEKGEVVKLYYHIPRKSDFLRRLNKLYQLQKAIQCCEHYYYSFLNSDYMLGDNNDIRKLLYVDLQGKYCVNSLAKYKIKCHIWDLEQLLGKYNVQDSDSYEPLVIEILSWLKKFPNKQTYLQDNSDKRILEEFLMENLDKPMDTESFKGFAKEYKKLRTKAFGKSKNDRLDRDSSGTTYIRNRLKEDNMGFTLIKDEDTITIKKYEEEKND